LKIFLQVYILIAYLKTDFGQFFSELTPYLRHKLSII